MTGIVAGLSALIVSAFVGSWPGPLLYTYAALLGLTALCGLSVLWITIWDIRTRGRGGRMRPIRAFDLAAAAMLAVPSAYALKMVWPSLGL